MNGEKITEVWVDEIATMKETGWKWVDLASKKDQTVFYTVDAEGRFEFPPQRNRHERRAAMAKMGRWDRRKSASPEGAIARRSQPHERATPGKGSR